MWKRVEDFAGVRKSNRNGEKDKNLFLKFRNVKLSIKFIIVMYFNLTSANFKNFLGHCASDS